MGLVGIGQTYMIRLGWVGFGCYESESRMLQAVHGGDDDDGNDVGDERLWFIASMSHIQLET